MPLSQYAIEFLKLQYKLGRVSEEDLNKLLEKEQITQRDKDYIMGKEE